MSHNAEIPASIESIMKGASFSHNLHHFSTTFNRLLCHQGTLKLGRKGKVSFSPVRLQNTGESELFDSPGKPGAGRVQGAAIYLFLKD